MPEAIHEYEARCSICGKTLTAATRDEAVRELEQHARQAHGKTISEQQAEKMVHKIARTSA